MSSSTCLALAMPPRTGGPSLMGPEGDVYYAVFVGVVIVALLIGSVIFYRRGRNGGSGALRAPGPTPGPGPGPVPGKDREAP